MPHPHLISFVIPAWNEESVLGPTLEAVSVAARHLVEPSEVIVADDSSTARTAEIARQHGARVVTVQHRQISGTRNAGARVAQGDLLIFIDADTIVTPEAVRASEQAVFAEALQCPTPEARVAYLEAELVKLRYFVGLKIEEAAVEKPIEAEHGKAC